MRWRWACLVVLAASIGRAATDDLLRAEQYYQRGMLAESLSNAEYRTWVKTVRSNHFDTAVNRWVIAVDQYSNAVRLNPAHWRAHKRLGLLFAEAQGTESNDTLALLHLVAYLSLAPDDPGAAHAKSLADQRMMMAIARRSSEHGVGEHHLNPVHAFTQDHETYLTDYQAGSRKALDDAQKLNLGEEFTRALPSIFGQQIHYNIRLAERILLRDQASAGTAGGGAGGPGGPAGGPGAVSSPGGSAGAPAPGSVGGAPGAGPGLAGAGGGATASTALTTETLDAHQTRDLYRDLAMMSSYVPYFLGMIGSMHRFTQYLDARQVAYDRRLPEAVIGESLLAMRALFTRSRVLGVGAFRSDYSKMAEGGKLSAYDFWTLRLRSSGDYLSAAGDGKEKPDIEAEFYRKSTEGETVRMPGYDKRPDKATEFAKAIGSATFSVSESQRTWLAWRNVLLASISDANGPRTADQVFVTDIMRLGSGEITPWVSGALPVPTKTAALPMGQRDWLVAAAR